MNNNLCKQYMAGLCSKNIQDNDCLLCPKQEWWMLRNDGVLFNELPLLTEFWLNTDDILDSAERLYDMTLLSETKKLILFLVRTWLETFRQDNMMVKPAIDYLKNNYLPYHITKRFIFTHIKELMNIKPFKVDFDDLVLDLDRSIKEEFVFIVRNDNKIVFNIYSNSYNWSKIILEFLNIVPKSNINDIEIKYLYK